jgi:hypothetical protein
MLSFNNIGNLGRLANQMFQYAALKGIATHRGYEFCIPPQELFGVFDKNVKNDLTQIYDLFDIKESNSIQVTGNKVVKESGFHFNEDLFNNCEDNVDLLGYFQSEKYFKHIEDEIRKDFTFKSDVILDCRAFFDEYFIDKKVISLHVRRGDYVSNPNHPVQDLSYYEEALKQFEEDAQVLIFSDDPAWCEQQEIFEGERFFVSKGGDPIADLCIMTLCNYHIIANSSYSWWGSWLANSEKTVAPKNWFAGDCAGHDTKDLYCENWIVI